jgi:hypothetical protein
VIVVAGGGNAWRPSRLVFKEVTMSMSVSTNDTSREAAEVQQRCFRMLTPTERIRKACAMSRRNRLMAFEAIRRQHPSLPPSDIQLAYIALAYGRALAADVRRWRQERGT